MKKIITFFLPRNFDAIIQESGESIFEKYQIFIPTLLLFLFIAFTTGIIEIMSGGSLTKVTLQFATFILLLLCLVLIKFTKQYKIAVSLPFLVAMIHLPLKYYQHQTILSPTPIFFIIVPPLMTYLISRRAGIWGTVFFMGEFLTTSYLIKLHTSPHAISFSNKEIVMMFSTIVATLVWVSFMNLFEKVRREYEEKLKKKMIAYSHSANLASLGEMAAAMAHEINNPLSIIKGNAQFLERKIADEKLNKKLNTITSTVGRITDIIQALLRLSRSDTSFTKRKTKFSEVFDTFYPLVAETLKNRQVEFRFDPAIKNQIIFSNAEILSQALINLFSNSFYAIEDLDEKWIELKLEKTSSCTKILFIDSGNGIPLRIVSRMMEPFFTTKEIGHGTGLGLSMVKNTVEQMGCQFYYDGSSKNTTFVIEVYS